MKKLLLATNNPGKLGEMKRGLSSLHNAGWQLYSPAELGITTEPEETGTTFKENALLKAKFYANLAKMSVVSDDGGFVIPALNYEPGVKSHRWLGRESTDDELIQHTLERTAGFAGDQRQAYLELVLCFYDPATKLTLFENEKIMGHIADKPTKKRIHGFPYRALLEVEPYGKYYDELSEEEHMAANHRLRALSKLISKLSIHYASK